MSEVVAGALPDPLRCSRSCSSRGWSRTRRGAWN